MMRLKTFGVLLLFLAISQAAAYCENSDGKTPFVYEDHGKRDPMWPLVTAGGSVVNYDTDLAVADFNLEGIMIGGNKEKVALINGRIVKVNEKIGQYVVVEITNNSVALRNGEQTYNLILKKEE